MVIPAPLRWLLRLTISVAMLCPIAYRWLDNLISKWCDTYVRGLQAPAAAVTAALDSVVQGPLFYPPRLLLLAGLLLGARLLTRRPVFTLLFATALLRIGSEGAANIVKMQIHRPRPVGYAQFTDSFPSTHTAIYFGTFLLAAAYAPRYRWWILPVPIFVGAERVLGNLHYLSDVFAGIALAGLLTSGFLSLALLADKSLRRASRPQPGAVA